MSRIIFDYEKYFEAKNKLPKPDGKHCVICGELLPPRKRKYCSTECYSNWYKSLNVSWESARHQALQRDKVCQNCGHDGREYRKNGVLIYNYLEVHHIKPISQGGAEFDLDNLMTLCEECHKIMHGKGSKLNSPMLNRQLSEFL